MMQKNILFLFPDQHRGDWMPYDQAAGQSFGMPSLPLQMQNIRFLMDHGTTFTRAATNSPLCVPARACLALGQDYDRCGAWNNDFCCPLTPPTFYRVLRDGGYQVAGVGKFDLHKPIMYWGEDGWIPQLETLGFTDALESEGKGDAVWAFHHGVPGPYGAFLSRKGLMEDYCADHLRRAKIPDDSTPSVIPPSAYADNWVADNALTALRSLTQKTTPWFLMVNFSGPHDPWDVTADMKARWRDVRFPLPADYSGDREALNGVRQNYAAMLENIDRNIGRILDELRRSGQYENTVIIYASDHGEMLGDRNSYYKSLPYRPSVHIPLVISGPHVLQRHTCDELVQLHDLAATITAFAGLKLEEGADAKSLLPLATQADAPPVRAQQYSALYTHLRAPAENDAAYGAYASYRKPTPHNGAVSKSRKTPSWRSLITKAYQYIEYLEPAHQELYDLRADPTQQRNIADASPALVQHFQSLLAAREHGEGSHLCPF